MEILPVLSVFCCVSIYLTTVQAELLEISPNIYSGRKNPVWSIAKPVDATKAAHFSKLVSLLMKLPKPPKNELFASGYNGFVIKHVLDSGMMHSIEVAKCSYPTLETALLETAPLDIDPSIMSKGTSQKIQQMIDSCTQKATSG